MTFPQRCLSPFLILAVGLSIISCDPAPKVSRACAGFDHPLAQDWAIDQIGNVHHFVDQKGQEARFLLVEAKSDSPYTGGASGGTEEEIVCSGRSNRSYQIDSSSYRYSMNFYQVQWRKDDSFEKQPLRLSSSTTFPPTGKSQLDSISGGNNRHTYPSFNFEVTEFSRYPDPPEYKTTYEPTRTINEVNYTGVMEQTLTPQEVAKRYPADALPEAVWTRVVFAKNFGLVQFENRSGQVFTRVAP